MGKSIKKKLKKAGMYEEVVSIIKNEIIDRLDSENLHVLNDGTEVKGSIIVKEASYLLDMIKNKKDKYINTSYLVDIIKTEEGLHIDSYDLADKIKYLIKYVDEMCDTHINNYTICLSHRGSTYHNLTYIRAWLILRTITDYIWLSPDEIKEYGFKRWNIPSGWRKDETDEAIR